MDMKRIFTLILLVFSLVNLYADEKGELWTKANDAYSMGQYETALNDYMEIEKNGYQSYKLYYNMGNAWYKTGNMGKAILYYEKALKLNPAGEDALNNLQIAKLQTLDKIDVLPEFIVSTWIKDIRNLMSSNGWGYTAVGLFAVVCILLLLFKFAPTTGGRKLSFVLACVAFLFFIFAVLFAFSLRAKAKSEDNAVVMVPVSNVKSAPNSTGNNLFILHEGSKVEILEQAGKWCRIEISDGRQGWLEEKDIEVI
ncbi:MAG: tetratricopeptide repeat protein [Bacteroidales bacterium]|nr:tetratricopeptide repeat protein [Bacteroidales bacterium]